MVVILLVFLSFIGARLYYKIASLEERISAPEFLYGYDTGNGRIVSIDTKYLPLRYNDYFKLHSPDRKASQFVQFKEFSVICDFNGDIKIMMSVFSTGLQIPWRELEIFNGDSLKEKISREYDNYNVQGCVK